MGRGDEPSLPGRDSKIRTDRGPETEPQASNAIEICESTATARRKSERRLSIEGPLSTAAQAGTEDNIKLQHRADRKHRPHELENAETTQR